MRAPEKIARLGEGPQPMPDAPIVFIAIALSLLLAAIVAFGRGANRCAVRPRRSD